jgi:hypothetical protein
MEDLLKRAPKSQSRVFPYIGGEEVNTSPSQQPERYVIFLSDIKEEGELENWPELAEIVRQRVKPERDTLGDNPNNIPLKRRWWAYQAHRPELYERVNKLERVLVNSQTSGHLAFAFLPPGWIYSQKLNVYDVSSFATFCVVQSRVHEIWARFFGSSLKDDLCYTPSDCFETFPFPPNFQSNAMLEEAGRTYYEFRAKLMVHENEGLTKLYNRFNLPEDSSAEILHIRELHAHMDQAVLKSYGWLDITPTWEFGLQFSDDEDEDESDRSQKRKYRYRWPDEIRDDVLARLLKLNRQRALEEGQLLGAAADTSDKPKHNRRQKKGKAQSATASSELLFGTGKGEEQ